MLLLTLEPTEGLATVTDEAIDDLVSTLRDANGSGVPVVVRFAHEMNGSWYAWGQHPAYVSRSAGWPTPSTGAPGRAWSGRPAMAAATPSSAANTRPPPGPTPARSTRTMTASSRADDPYAPYLAGDEAVDWVGMSLYHWGTAYPWGRERGAGRRQVRRPAARAVPPRRRRRARRPRLLRRVRLDPPQTGRHHRDRRPRRPGPRWRQGDGRQAGVVAPGLRPRLADALPRLKMVSWFEWAKYEPEVKGKVDWAVTRETPAAQRFRCRPAGVGGHGIGRSDVRGPGHGLTGCTLRTPRRDAALTQCG